MYYLGLSILTSTSIVIIFKFLVRYKVNTFHVIVINYIIASLLGYLLTQQRLSFHLIFNSSWLPFAIIIGILFIIMFYIFGISIKKIGVTIPTVSGRMSLVIPIIFTLIAFKEIMSTLKILGIILALIAIVLTLIKKREEKYISKFFYLPVLLFFGLGLVDSIIKYAQQEFITDEILPIFSAFVFTIAGIIGILICIIRRIPFNDLIKRKVLIFGVLLGIVNFGSIFFFVKALTYSGLDSSVVFGINHIGIVVLSVVLALVLFKEKLSFLNWFGILISLVAIYLLTKSQLT